MGESIIRSTFAPAEIGRVPNSRAIKRTSSASRPRHSGGRLMRTRSIVNEGFNAGSLLESAPEMPRWFAAISFQEDPRRAGPDRTERQLFHFSLTPARPRWQRAKGKSDFALRRPDMPRAGLRCEYSRPSSSRLLLGIENQLSNVEERPAAEAFSTIGFALLRREREIQRPPGNADKKRDRDDLACLWSRCRARCAARFAREDG